MTAFGRDATLVEVLSLVQAPKLPPVVSGTTTRSLESARNPHLCALCYCADLGGGDAGRSRRTPTGNT